MALLTIAKRKKYFKDLKLGEYNEANIKKFQKKYFIRTKDIDGVYGKNTDILLRHVWNCNLVKNFEPSEFKCDCGGKYCTGYPTRMRAITLQFLQKIRDTYNKPVIVTSGLRCKKQNNVTSGSISNSKHLYGVAVDYAIIGVTDKIQGRKDLINLIKNWDHHDYSYCNGYDSSDKNRIAINLGNAIHTQTN